MRIPARSFQRILAISPLSFKEIAEYVGVSESTVGRWATGEYKPTVYQVAKTREAINRRMIRIDQVLRQLDEDIHDWQRIVAGVEGDADYEPTGTFTRSEKR